MLTAHYAVALVAKRSEPRINLGTLTIAAMFADLAWCFFMLIGLEHVHFGPGMGAGKYLFATDIALSHSLFMDGVWATLFASAYYLRQRYPRGAWIVFLAVLSHWVLDFVSHKADMPIVPGIHRYVGLGLWNSIPGTIVVEGSVWCLSIILFVRDVRPNRRAGSYIFWCGVVLLTLLWFNNIAGPAPPAPKTAPFNSLLVFALTIAWAYWVDQTWAHTRLGGLQGP